MDRRDDDRHHEQVAEAWRMRVYEHATQTQIANALDVHQSTISRWLTATARDRIGERKELIGLYFAEQLEKLDMLYKEVLVAWHASKEPRKSVTKRVARTAVSDPSGQAVTMQGYQPLEEVVVTRVDDQDGDVGYLHAARAILCRHPRAAGAERAEIGGGWRAGRRKHAERRAVRARQRPW
jgi:hypothetical protein